MMSSQPKNHTDFILSPLTKIVTDVTSASVGMGDGIETYPACDYLMQSVFLKMTGAQEQKMKCICWELATHDYEYRYDRYNNPRGQLGECSTFKEKQTVYKDLFGQIIKHGDPQYNQNSIDKGKILNDTTTSINSTFSDTNLVTWAQNSFISFTSIWSSIDTRFFIGDKDNLFPKVQNSYSLKEIYSNHLYKNRNRIAHNTKSYQQNLPTLKTLMDENYKYENYFVYFAVLVLIDNIFIHLYKDYLKVIEDV
ncbi:MAG: hypothetical protein AAF806_01350 [Bacteroidota bacterium]